MVEVASLSGITVHNSWWYVSSALNRALMMSWLPATENSIRLFSASHSASMLARVLATSLTYCFCSILFVPFLTIKAMGNRNVAYYVSTLFRLSFLPLLLLIAKVKGDGPGEHLRDGDCRFSE